MNAGWSGVGDGDGLVLTIAAILFVGTLAVAVPTLIGRRSGQTLDAVRWADRGRREDGAAWAADRTLRAVRESCLQAGLRFPGIVRCTLGTTVVLDLAAPTIAPPAPWATSRDGRTWSAPMWALQALGLEEPAGDEFAAVVTLGSTQTGTVLADLRRAGGVIAFTGDAAATTAVARRLVDQLHTDPWSVATPVLSVGVGAGEIGATTPVSLADAVAAVRDDAGPGLVVLRSAPRGAAASVLSAALALPGNRWAVVVLGPVRYARWTFHVARDGFMTSDEFGTLCWSDVALSTAREREPDVTDGRTPPADVAIQADGRRPGTRA